MSAKARILFVDDEKRVLNAMRGLFRREYELFLTTEGSEAIRIAAENEVDVIVADQRMPGLTGIEVLGKVKELSPRTVRILLTGYADPSAVEGSINIGEVFRFLSKPCPPGLLRETLGLAINASRTQPVARENAAHTQAVARESAAKPAPAPTATQTPTPTSTPAPAANPTPAATPPPAPAAASVPAVREQNAPLPPATTPAPLRARPEAPVTPPTPPAPVLPVVTPVAAANPAASPGPLRRPEPASPDANPLPDIPVLQDAVVPAANDAEDELLSDEDTQPALPVLNLDDVKANEPEPEPASHWHSVTHVILSEDTIEETQSNKVIAEPTQGVKDVGVVIFTVDSEFAEMAIRAISADRSTVLATTLVKVAHAIEHHQAGVLVTDFTTNSAVLKKMIAALKQHMPELVTIVVSSGRDTTDMINLINYGQVFRYVLKPIEPRDLRNDVNAAAIRYLYLVNNPESAKRHQVMEAPAPAEEESSTLNRFLGRIRKIQSERSDASDIAAK